MRIKWHTLWQQTLRFDLDSKLTFGLRYVMPYINRCVAMTQTLWHPFCVSISNLPSVINKNVCWSKRAWDDLMSGQWQNAEPWSLRTASIIWSWLNYTDPMSTMEAESILIFTHFDLKWLKLTWYQAVYSQNLTPTNFRYWWSHWHYKFQVISFLFVA